MGNTVDSGSTSQPILQDNQREVDTVFDVLTHSYRRTIISSLLVQDSGAFEHELIEDILQDPSSTAGPVKDYSQITTAVIHSHLPKLVDAGLVEWDRDQRFVEPTASLSALEPLLDVADLL